MIVVGIDLGVSGAVSAVDSRGTCQVEDLPIVGKAGEKEVDALALIRLIRSMVPIGEPAVATIEDVRVRVIAGRKMSHKTETSLVMARGAVQAVLRIARIDIHAVQPQAWKRFYGIADDKDGAKARATAAKLYPLAGGKLKRVKDHNRAESLLLAHYGKAKLT